MSCISTSCQQSLTLDPHKRVCYSQGLVLGVDEFVQEELYFLEQHRRHARGLHGYCACRLLSRGAIRGLIRMAARFVGERSHARRQHTAKA